MARSLLVPVLCAACMPPWPEFPDVPVCDTLDTDPVCPDIFGGSSSSVTGGSSSGPGIMTTTYDTHGPGETHGPDDTPPPDDTDAGFSAALSLSITNVVEVGPVEITLAVSGAAKSVDLYDNDRPILVDAPPLAALHTLAVTSEQAPGDGPHEILAIVHAEDGRTAFASAELLIDVPASGTQAWQHRDDAVISTYTAAAPYKAQLAVAGHALTLGDSPCLVVATLDGVTGLPTGATHVFEEIAPSSAGPALLVGPDDTVYVAATVPSGATTRPELRALREIDAFGPPSWKWLPQIGAEHEEVTALAICDDRLVAVGSLRTQLNPPRHDLRVRWLSLESGAEIAAATFAAPKDEDPVNDLNERAYGVACVDGDTVVVGTREIWPGMKNFVHVRTVVLRYDAPGASPSFWTSPGDVLAEDAALAITPTKKGGFAVTGWARELGGSVRQVLTRRFAAKGIHLWARIEVTPGSDATGHALAEDREGKLIVAAGRERPGTDLDAWIFATTGPLEPRTWEVLRNGPSNGPDEALGLALDEWGYAFPVGVEMQELESHAFALRLYP